MNDVIISAISIRAPNVQFPWTIIADIMDEKPHKSDRIRLTESHMRNRWNTQ